MILLTPLDCRTFSSRWAQESFNMPNALLRGAQQKREHWTWISGKLLVCRAAEEGWLLQRSELLPEAQREFEATPLIPRFILKGHRLSQDELWLKITLLKHLKFQPFWKKQQRSLRFPVVSQPWSFSCHSGPLKLRSAVIRIMLGTCSLQCHNQTN